MSDFCAMPKINYTEKFSISLIRIPVKFELPHLRSNFHSAPSPKSSSHQPEGAAYTQTGVLTGIPPAISLDVVFTERVFK